MITVKYDKRRNLLICEGHAGYAEIGKDIVCAAVSATMRMVVTAAYTDGDSAEVKDGYIRVKLGKKSRDAAAVMRTAYACLEALAVEYPENVRAFLS